MPPSIEDVAPLAAIAGTLREIANIVANFGERAAKASEKGSHSHVTPLEQVNRSLVEIAEELKGISPVGDHSAQYRAIERSLEAIASAVKGLSSRS